MPGVNLKVGYLAWRGLNHEDAWVLSASAAARLEAPEDVEQTIAIRAVEMPARWLVQPGDAVEEGQLLIERCVAPALLTASFRVLGTLGKADDTVPLRPETEDRARSAGVVAAIEQDERVGLAGELAGAWRAVYQVRLRRTRQLAVGDKLANRHGHKGVVGAILPDDEMPRWRGRPLDALIDPISVLNRSNWGQVHESLAGATAGEREAVSAAGLTGTEVLRRAAAMGFDRQGRSWIDPPVKGDWLTETVSAVAGVQFVMRLPHHAEDRLSASPVAGRRDVRVRFQRLGEMDQWALSAHGCAALPDEAAGLTPAATRLGRLLRAAGYDLAAEGEALRVRRLDLSAPPPAQARQANPGSGTRGEAFDALEEEGVEVVLVFEPAVEGVWPGWAEEEPAQEERLTVALAAGAAAGRPPAARAAGRLGGAARADARLAQWCGRPGRARADGAGPAVAIHRLLRAAYSEAVGRSATGPASSKRAWLRRGVLGRRASRSARATATPGGDLGLALDEIGLPQVLAAAVLGPDLPAEEPARSAALAGRSVWLKRDPVLHRWGLLPVRRATDSRRDGAAAGFAAGADGRRL